MEKSPLSQLRLLDSKGCIPAEPTVLKVRDNLCYESAHHTVDAVRASLAQCPSRIVLDMELVSAIDSSGLKALLQIRKLCEEAGTELKLASLSPCVDRIIAMSRLSAAFGLPERTLERKVESLAEELDFDSAKWNVREYVATSDPAVISAMRLKVVDAAVSAGAKGETLCDIQIAVGEALTNAYKHGSPRKGVDKIKLRCMSCTGALVVEIEDEGNPFDPDGTPEPDPALLRDHGMGIYLMRQAMDVVDYKTGCPGTRVRMVKWLNGDKQGPACKI